MTMQLSYHIILLSEVKHYICIAIVQQPTVLHTLRNFSEARVNVLEKTVQSQQKIIDQKDKQ